MERAFSLVELSIVLVIIGILVGGVLAGQSLVRAAELRSVTAEYHKYVTSTYAFKNKYMALPGDMAQAVLFWGAQAGTTADGLDATCAALTSASTTAATCNGNGDGLIAMSNLANDRTQWYESYRAWQHLANAGLIEGRYSGVSGTGQTSLVNNPGVNAPSSKLGSNASWLWRHIYALLSSSAVWIAGPWGNILVLGGTSGANSQPVLKTHEAWNVDTKIDDGMPGLGTVMAYGSSVNPGCMTANATTANYNLTTTTTACALNMLLK